MPRPSLINLDVGELCASAGGDPWSIDEQLQAGQPGAIDNLADAFHRCSNHVKESDDDFDKAKRKFTEAYTRNGSEHPIADAGEVRRVSEKLADHKDAVLKIAVALEQIAAALAVAQRDSDAEIAAVNAELHTIDNQMSDATDGQDTSGLHTQAVETVRSGLEQITTIRGGYVEQLRQAETVMTVAGYEPDAIDNVDGIPAGTPTQRASAANEKRLREERARAQAELTRLQRELGQMLATDHDWNKGPLDELANRIRAVQGRLADLDGIDHAMANAPETYLAQLDIPADYSGKVHSAVAVGNPDTASNVTVTVPGLGATIKDTLPEMVKESWDMQDQAELQLRLAGQPASVANISWVGYDPPPNAINTMSPRDAWAAINADEARTGAANLSTYLEQVRDNNPSAHVTLLGHSYGSLTSSLALQELNAQGLHPVNDVVFYGSPGLGLTDPAQQLGLGAGHAYVMGDPSDPIVSWAAPVSDVHGWGDNPYNGMLPQLSAQAGTDPAGVYHPGIDGHADYTRLFHDPSTDQDVMRMSQYNLAAIAAGLPDNAVMATPQTPAPRPHAPSVLPPFLPPGIAFG